MSSSAAARLKRFFAPGGGLSRAHPAYEPREAQFRMAEQVLAALEEGAHLVVEAGTGVGKTLAYLLPAILSRRKCIISTGTKALQDQLALKDVPFLQERCRLEFSAAVLKGRDNYLCKLRFEQFRAAPTILSRLESDVWPEVEAWGETTLSGDIAEVPGLPENPGFWEEINAKSSTCLGVRCPSYDTCHLGEVRRAAQDADLVIVNHHLYLADAAVRHEAFGTILPDVSLAIFDEAHKLEGAATSFFGRSISNWRLRELADDVLRELPRAGMEAPLVLKRADELKRAAESLPAPWSHVDGRALLPARLLPEQEDALAIAAAAVSGLRSALSTLSAAPLSLEPFARRADDMRADLELLASREDASHVYWSETRGRGVHLCATPIDIGPLLKERVFSRLEASVLCSATLAVGGSMKHVRARLGLVFEEGDETALEVRESIQPSPFDFETQGLLYLPRNMPEPRSPDFAAACARTTRELLDASRGRAFVLFTSFENLRRVHEMLREDLPFPLLVQGEAQKHELLSRFRTEENCVLLATSSFWEGVDVAGEALSLVVIDKLPFAVPSDPIVAARSRQIEERGGDPFRELSIPDAILMLKQGVGRLIRGTTDRGVVSILDPRVVTTQYGRVFLANLPPFSRTREMDDVRRFFG